MLRWIGLPRRSDVAGVSAVPPGKDRPALRERPALHSCYFSTLENSPVDAFTATRSLAVSRSVP
jgi:hypothetical protein